MRPKNAPAVMTAVIAAKTNWKYTIVAFGKAAVMFATGKTAYADACQLPPSSRVKDWEITNLFEFCVY